ncbi:MAG TPA: DapH/DapD/GlmU-related protein [Allosphingosinicella sp.]|nr:DapH/DapD/GlmU-related protein [Allosphingosinicella sp.]
MTRLAFIGGGGFAKEALELAELGGHEVVGYVGESEGVLDRPYWGAMDALTGRRGDFDAVCIAFGGVDRKGMAARSLVVAWLRDNGFRSETLVSPHATVAAGASVGEGSIVAHGVVISVDARIGAHCILNTSAIVGHDAVIGDNVVIAPAAFIGGLAGVGENSLIGPGATVLQGLKVGRDVIVGVGASVLRNVADGATVWPHRSKVISAG